MSRFTTNVAANITGRIGAAVVGLVFVPIIVRLMGIESYGLVTFFATVQAVFSVLDLGLSATINRELARHNAMDAPARDRRDLVRTLEVCYWAVAVVIGAVVIAMTPAVAGWVRVSRLSSSDVRHAVLIMGFVVALQWPLSFYEGGLLGTQRQVLWNVISLSMNVIRQVGAVLVLWLVSPTVQAYLVWQAASYGLQTLTTASWLWRSLPAGEERAMFRPGVVRDIWRFAAGLTGTSIVSLGLTQIDKVVLSRTLTLEQFGYYGLAAVAAGGLHYLIGPAFNAAFPRFSELVAAEDGRSLRDHYHRVAQTTAVIVIPAAVVLVLFAADVMRVWTHDAATAAKTHLVVSILAAGTALNGVTHIPYALQLASGWTTLTLITNACALVVIVPVTIVAAQIYGPVGVASVWVALNLVYVFVTVPMMHRRLLRHEVGRWYAIDLGIPLAAAVAVAVVGRWLFVPTASAAIAIAQIAVVSALTLAAAAWATPATRGLLRAVCSGGASGIAAWYRTAW